MVASGGEWWRVVVTDRGESWRTVAGSGEYWRVVAGGSRSWRVLASRDEFRRLVEGLTDIADSGEW